MAKQYYTFRDWMDAAIAEEQEALAKALCVSRSYLYALSTDRRRITPEMAGRIVEATKPLRRKAKGRLPGLTRAGLCSVCAKCPHANPTGLTVRKG